jgi:asparagine synthase (glutamine-hydrolysing)
MSGYLAVVGGGVRSWPACATERVAAEIAFRSPDGIGAWRGGDAVLVQGLLRVYSDDDRDARPRTLDGRVWIVGDLRLDAREELRAALGRALRTRPPRGTDAELVLHAYRAWGDSCVERLLGDFSFVLWDAPAGRALMAVDPLGVRPLYYARAEGGLVAGNTLLSLLQAPGVSHGLDETSVVDQLLSGLIEDPEATMFADVRSFPGGGRGRWTATGGFAVDRYWRPEPQDELGLRHGADYVDAFREVFAASVRDRLRGSPASITMSGGLDSTLLAAFAAGELEEERVVGGIRAWCASYESSFADPEPAFARAAAEHIGIPLRVFDTASAPLFGAPAPRPGPASPLATVHFAMAREMTSHARLSLSGYDGDSLLRFPFSEYLRTLAAGGRLFALARAAIQTAQVAAHNRRLPRIGIRKVLRLRRSEPAAPPVPPEWLTRTAAVRPSVDHPGDDFRAEVRASLISPPWTRLHRSFDADAIGFPIVTAHPFMDLRVMRFLHSLPPFPWCVEKQILRDAGRGLLPGRILRRRKTTLAGSSLSGRVPEIRAALDNLRDAWPLHEYVDLALLPPLDVTPDADVQWEVARIIGLATWLRSSSSTAFAEHSSPALDWIGDRHDPAEEGLPEPRTGGLR